MYVSGCAAVIEKFAQGVVRMKCIKHVTQNNVLIVNHIKSGACGWDLHPQSSQMPLDVSLRAVRKRETHERQRRFRADLGVTPTGWDLHPQSSQMPLDVSKSCSQV